MDTSSEQQQDGIRIMRHTYFRFGTCDVLSEFAKEACEGKGFGWFGKREMVQIEKSVLKAQGAGKGLSCGKSWVSEGQGGCYK